MTMKTVEKNLVTGDPWDRESTPWGIEAALLEQQEGISFQEARDAVILHYLHFSGDIRPLQALLSTGNAPGPKILLYLSYMMEKSIEMETPFELIIKGRDGKKRKNGELHLRNNLIANLIRQRRKKGEFYEAAITAEAEALDLSYGHAKKIYSKFYKDDKGDKKSQD